MCFPYTWLINVVSKWMRSVKRWTSQLPLPSLSPWLHWEWGVDFSLHVSQNLAIKTHTRTKLYQNNKHVAMYSTFFSQQIAPFHFRWLWKTCSMSLCAIKACCAKSATSFTTLARKRGSLEVSRNLWGINLKITGLPGSSPPPPRTTSEGRQEIRSS